nr:ATP-binding cassette domain-containing protein [Actinopolyspora mortivallis]
MALNDVSWCIGTGVNGLLGPNGAGKTTLLSLLVTLAKPSEGTVRIGEHELTTAGGRKAARRLLGFVPQRFSLAPEMRLRDTVAYTAWVNGVPDADCMAAAEPALREVGLREQARSRVRTLSGGQRQRLGIAAALAHDPAVVVLDEPTVGLDPGQRLRVREMIARLGQQRTVVLSSHLLEDVARLCSRVAVLAEGKLVFDDTNERFHTVLEDTANAAESSALGSGFELAYEALVSRLGE